MKKILITLLIIIICFPSVYGNGDNVKYRTFSQESLSEKPNKLKEYNSRWRFELRNNIRSSELVNGLRLVFNAKVKSIIDAKPFTNISGLGTKTIDLSGAIIDSGQVVNIEGIGEKKQMTIKKYIWLRDGNKIGQAFSAPNPTQYQHLLPMPNFGWVRWLIYSNLYTAQGGLLIGIERVDSPSTYGWLHYMNGAVTREAFPHTAPARGFDTWGKIGNTQQPFIGPKKNFKVWKHDNHLLGEVHALKLAVAANDIGLTEPDTPHTALGDLIFNDLNNLSNPMNGKTIRQILHHADSALTMWRHFPVGYHIWLDSIITMINGAFVGEMDTISTHPLKVKGAVPLSDVPFLNFNPIAKRVNFYSNNFIEFIEMPKLYQNYPNPFNSITNINFVICEDGWVSLKVYNLLGVEIANLLENKYLEANYYSVKFDASNLPSGVYIYQIILSGNQNFVESKKMIFLK